MRQPGPISGCTTAEIVAFAQQLASGVEYADIKATLARCDVPASVSRSDVAVLCATRGGRELWDLDRRELNVAMARARDGLGVGVVG